MIEIDIKRLEGDYGFEATDANGHHVRMDTSPDGGGINFGVRPMQILLMGLGGCSGIDVVSILKKQRQQVDGFSMKIKGEREKDVVPSLWETVHIVFELTGQIDPDKARKACELSVQKYCSVAETLRKGGAAITWSLIVNGQEA
ncbi:MAG: OsmC family protein [Bacteroidetes bacterium]|nr:OsmC family protein [Bacteroidota bacterium]